MCSRINYGPVSRSRIKIRPSNTRYFSNSKGCGIITETSTTDTPDNKARMQNYKVKNKLTDD